MIANRGESSAIDLLRLGHCAPRVNEVIIASMRRIYYTSGVLAVLVLVLFCCWHGSKQDPKQPHELASAAVQGLPIPEAPEASEATEAAPTPAIASRDQHAVMFARSNFAVEQVDVADELGDPA